MGSSTSCASTTATSGWVQYGNDGIYRDVDISGCGFTSAPTISSGLTGLGYHYGERWVVPVHDHRDRLSRVRELRGHHAGQGDRLRLEDRLDRHQAHRLSYYGTS